MLDGTHIEYPSNSQWETFLTSQSSQSVLTISKLGPGPLFTFSVKLYSGGDDQAPG